MSFARQAYSSMYPDMQAPFKTLTDTCCSTADGALNPEAEHDMKTSGLGVSAQSHSRKELEFAASVSWITSSAEDGSTFAVSLLNGAVLPLALADVAGAAGTEVGAGKNSADNV